MSHAQQENLFEHFSQFWGQSGKKKRKNQSRSIAFYNYDITISIAMMYISIYLGPRDRTLDGMNEPHKKIKRLHDEQSTKKIVGRFMTQSLGLSLKGAFE